MIKLALIMAGGNGTRFWPTSTHKKPKQFLNLSGNASLLAMTQERLAPIIPDEFQFIVGNEDHQDVLLEHAKHQQIFFEPMARNTSAAIIAPLMALKHRYKHALVACLPSDHHIEDELAFREGLTLAYEVAEQNNCIVTLGIQPTYPATGYGYLHSEKSHSTQRRLKAFIEKPDKEKAETLFMDENFYWNAGIFVAPIDILLENAKQHLPKLYELAKPLEQWHALSKEEIKNIYQELPSISIDFGIMEKAKNIWMVPLNCGWNDLGSWDSISTFVDKDNSGNTLMGDAIAIESHHCSLVSDSKTIVCYGVDDLLVVEHNGTILVTKKEHSQKIKNVVEALKTQQRHDLL